MVTGRASRWDPKTCRKGVCQGSVTHYTVNLARQVDDTSSTCRRATSTVLVQGHGWPAINHRSQSMSQPPQVDVLAADVAHDNAPLDLKSFLITCAICSVVGLTVLAILAQALVSFLAPGG